ncbi:ubiquitin-activating E1 FCCH domain-containing protein [Pelagibius sp.]|uniref:ubiquitin-activating E1 FCCH domain-containing protein n=1 Tax=Pelagibius sp. TaxID=1931238 RepID=UPI003B505E29
MPRANPLQAAFNAGEIGPRLAARVDFGKYQNAGSRVENLIPLPQGGLTRRPGTRYVAAASSHEKRPRLLPFEFSTEQAYVLEGCDGCFRFFRDKGQVVVSETDAAISNGTFDSDITGWDDRSTGAASIDHVFLGGDSIDLLQFAEINNQGFGDGVSPRLNVGLKFTPAASGNIARARVQVPSLVAALTAAARLYTDNAGSPGVQVGSDSVSLALDTPGLYTFTWTTQPGVTDSTTYWMVLSDVSAPGPGSVNLSQCADRGPAFSSGFSDVITSIADASGGFFGARDLRMKIDIETANSNGALALLGNGSDVATAEQAVATTNTGQEHVLRFRVIGAPGDAIKLRIGNTSEGDQFLADLELKTGFHSIAFTPAMSPFYVQFRNSANKTIYVDDVALIGSGAGSSAPLELTVPYGEADYRTLKWAQSADVMYFAHPDHAPHKLERRGGTTWSLVEVAFQDGPFGLENTDTQKTLQPSSLNNGNITAAGHAPFKESDVGRLVRIKHGSTWGVAQITDVVSPESVAVSQLPNRNFGGTTASSEWRLGAWSSEQGYPSVVTFFEQRLVWANTRSQPQTFWMSQSGDLENMQPDSEEGGAIEVQDDDALDFTIAADQVNAIRWMSPGRQLILGTSGGEWSVTSDGPVLTPLDLTVRRESTNGSANTLPVRISSIVLFVQRAKRKLREFVFSFETDGFRTPDLTILADHISESGIREVAYQQEPDSQVHCLREDGVLATLTYRREQDVVGWSRHILGGSFQAGGAVVESITTIPGSQAAGSENRDETWVAVKRTINGATRRSIEAFEGPFEGPNPERFDDTAAYDKAVLAAQKCAFYVDGGLVLDNSIQISGASLAPAVVAQDSFEHWTGNVPDGWVVGGTGNISQSTVNVTDGVYSVLFSGLVDHISRSFDVTDVDTLEVDAEGTGATFQVRVDGGLEYSQLNASGTQVVDLSGYTGVVTIELRWDAFSGVAEYVDKLRLRNSSIMALEVTAPGHGLTDGDRVDFDGLQGLTELNGNRYVVANTTDDTLEVVGVDASLLGSYSGGGHLRKAVTTISGLDHLEGETVKILGDGAIQPDAVVSGGQVTLDSAVSQAVVGLGYRHVFRSLKLAFGAAAGTAVGKVKRVHGIVLVLLHSLGIRIGPSIDKLEAIPLREVKDAMDTAVPLFTGERHVSFEGDFERDARIVISDDAPLPFTLLAAAPELKTNEQL